MSKDTEFLDVYNLELKLREKMNELNWKTKSLEEAQGELSELRRAFHETQSLLEDERRSSMQLKMQLKSATETAKRLDDERTKNQSEHIRMTMNCETAQIERDALIGQARIAKLENIELRAKIQDLEASNSNCRALNATLEKSLLELRNSFTRVHTNLHSNAEKLEREQEKLRKSVADALNFGQRIQTTLKTSHAARHRDKKRIEELQKRVDELAAREPPAAAPQLPAEGNQTDIANLQLKMETTLQQLRRKLESNTIDDKLSMICNELRKVDGHLVAD